MYTIYHLFVGEDSEQKDLGDSESKSVLSLVLMVMNSRLKCSLITGPKVTYIPPSLPEDENTIFSHYGSGINFEKYDEILVEVGGSI